MPKKSEEIMIVWAQVVEVKKFNGNWNGTMDNGEGGR
jgi:hypothetical protein